MGYHWGMLEQLETQLQIVYADGWQKQQQRYVEAVGAFEAVFGRNPSQIFRAPGRVNLIGEHTDYNHGYVMPVAIDKDVLLLLRPRNDNQIHLHNFEAAFAPTTFAISADIARDEAADWSKYARGAAQRLCQEYGEEMLGFDGLIVGKAPFGVPHGAGLSSSSAFTVVVAVALVALNNLALEKPHLARLCQEAEWYAGTQGGIMDQYVALLGQKDHALFLDCRPNANAQFDTAHIPLPTDYALLIINSGIKHSNTAGGYNQRVAACRAAVGLLKAHYPTITHLRDVENVAWAELAAHLPAAITVAELAEQGIDLLTIPTMTPQTNLKVRARSRHVWTENQRVQQAVAALGQGDVARVGALMNAAHDSARDDYAISCPELEVLVTALREQAGVIGARLTGAGWGGCVVALVERARVKAVSQRVTEIYQVRVGFSAAPFACRSTAGAGLIWA